MATQQCRDKQTVTFPWSTEDLVKAWQLTYPDADQTNPPTRLQLCEKIKTDEMLYQTLLTKVKRRKQAEDELRAHKAQEASQQAAEAARKREEKEAARLAREQKREQKQAQAQPQPQSTTALQQNVKPVVVRRLGDPFTERDLVPFSPEVLAAAQAEVSPSSPEFWAHLYVKYADRMIPRLSRMDDVVDPVSDAVPSAEFPWSLKQLGRARNLAAHDFRHNAEFRARLAALRPAYDFLLLDRVFESSTLLDMAARLPHSPYIPWPAPFLNHFLRALTEEKTLSDQEPVQIRVALLRHWRANPLLRQYVSNLTPVLVKDMAWWRVASLGTLVSAYAAWPAADQEADYQKEFQLENLHNFWATEVLALTYQLHKVSYGRAGASYFQLLKDVVRHEKVYELVRSPVGVLLLKTPTETAQLQLHDIPFSAFKAAKPLKWNTASVVQRARDMLAKAELMAEKEAPRTQTVAVPREVEDEDQRLSSTAAEKLQSKMLANIFAMLHTYMNGTELFLVTLYHQNEDFRRFTAAFAGNSESLRALFVAAHGGEASGASREKVRTWALHERPLAAVPMFEQDHRSSVYPHMPPLLADSAKRFQQYVNDTWAQFRLPPVSAQPPASNCGPVATEGSQQRRHQHFLRPDHAQLFMNAEFTPGAFENGKIIVHSVGSGKTCLAVRIASDFAHAGFRIVWVTKHALRHQVLKNHVSEICNLLLREHYDRLSILEGPEAADEWLKHSVPAQTNVQDVLRLLKTLGMDWTNLSYRQFSNAVEHAPKNELGRAWRKHALPATYHPGRGGSADRDLDPLRKTLVIIDEAHKLFTGDLDRPELPNVPAIHRALQHSYRHSDTQRCRVLFLTATPTTDSMLPLISMLNMLHPHDVFEYNMRTIDPHIKSDQGLSEHLRELREQNRMAEERMACDMFPRGMQRCRQYQEGRPDPTRDKHNHNNDDDDDEEEEEDGQAYFDTKTIINGHTFKPRELTNHLQGFWRKAFGLISFYDISADYSKFPRTEFAPIIMPSATIFQERLMASELVSSKKDLHTQTKKIRQIAAWARFEAVGQPSRVPDSRDIVITAENQRHIFFEPTLHDLRLRREDVLSAIATEQAAEPDPRVKFTLDDQRNQLEQVQAAIHTRLVELDTLRRADEMARTLEKKDDDDGDSGRVASRKSQSQINKEAAVQRAINKLEAHARNWQNLVQQTEAELQFHQSAKQVKIQYLERRVKRIEQQLTRMEKRAENLPTHNAHDIGMFLQSIEEPAEPLLAEEDDEDETEAAAEESKRATLPTRRRRQATARQPKTAKKVKQTDVPDPDSDSDSEVPEGEDDDGDDDAAYEAEAREDERVEEKIKGEYYVKKSWILVKQPLPDERPRKPKRHYFDQPETFDAAQFLRDMPLYSPKAEALLRILTANDQDCLHTNPEDQPRDRLRKRMVFCQDIHDIRAVAGALMASGWTFGMKRKWVKWQKQYFATDTNKQVGRTLTAKAQQLTWLPSVEGGPEADYKRFLVLTRSRLGGVAGATLNDYAIQMLGAKGQEATYNHEDNLRGKNYRVILIDRSFMEGIDLPSTYCDLFDALMAKAERTQVVGRIARFCGNKDLPFVSNYGWPQRVYRYELKFHTVGLHLSPTQWERLGDKVRSEHSPYAPLIPARYQEAFLEKLEKNLFSPTELQILLDGNMELQRIRKKTLDVYEALMEKVSIGALLYAPAMRNLAVARHELDELLMEEEETAQEYRREIMAKDEKRRPTMTYQLRSLDKLKNRWRIVDNFLFSMLQYHVKTAMRNTPKHDVARWQDPSVVAQYFERQVKPDMQTAELLGTSEEYALSVLTNMFAEVVKERLTQHQQKQHKLSQLQRQVEESQALQHDKLLEHLITVAKGKNKRWSQVDREQVWTQVLAQQPQLTRPTFDRLFDGLRNRPTRSRHRPRVHGSSATHSSSSGARPSLSSHKSKGGRQTRTPLSALLAVKKALRLDKRQVKTSVDQQTQLVARTLAANPERFTREQVEGALKEWLSTKEV